MSEFIINGGRKLDGRTAVQGSKNAALPVLAAALLVAGPVELYNCPELSDVDNALEILRFLGCAAKREGNAVYIDSRGLSGYAIPDVLMKRMRSSVVFLGAILARTGRVETSYPGGCLLGARPINYHLDGLRQLGVWVEERDGRVTCERSSMIGTDICLPFPSVGATENILLAATACRGTTRIRGAAQEPEICDLAAFMRSCGIDVRGDGTPELTVEGEADTHSAGFTIMPDRIATGTYLCAAAAARGKVRLDGTRPEHNGALLDKLRRSGCDILCGSDFMELRTGGEIRSVGLTSTAPYPDFPTDMQPPLMGLMCSAKGETIFVENIFESRYNQVEGLRLMGADITIDGTRATVRGTRLHGARVSAADLRGGAALITAALSADGETVIAGSKFIDRGYERIEEKLGALGADIIRK